MTSIEKMLIDQYHQQGMGHTEIAAKLNLSVNTVKSYWRRKKVAGSSPGEVEVMAEKMSSAVEQISSTVPPIISAVGPVTDTLGTDEQAANTDAQATTNAVVSPAAPVVVAPASSQSKETGDVLTIICKQCGATATTTRHDKEFCSARCRKQWWHSHRGDSINAVDHVCPVCGQHFRTNRKQTYCCHSCYIKGRFAPHVYCLA